MITKESPTFTADQILQNVRLGEELYSVGWDLDDIAKYFGVLPDTYFSWRRHYQSLYLDYMAEKRRLEEKEEQLAKMQKELTAMMAALPKSQDN